MISSRLGRLLVLAALTCAAAPTLAACTVEEAPAQKVAKKKTPSKATKTADDEDEDDDSTTASKGSSPGTNGATPGTNSGAPTTPASTPGAPTAPALDVTNGTGGPTGFNTLKSTGGLSYQINAPATATAHGLLVLLHGSSASNYTKMVDMMATVAQEHDLIRVSVLAPNGQGWNEGDQVNAAKLLNDLVQQDLFPKYNIDKTKVLFSGQSSGGGFLATNFIPAFGKGYKGGAFLQCGMDAPRTTFTPDETMKQTFKLHFEITTGDTIWPEAFKDAIAAYTSAGMQLTKDNTKTGGHCAFDQQKVIQDHIGFILGTTK